MDFDKIEMQDICDGCEFHYIKGFAHFYENEENTDEFLRAHHILPGKVRCPKCNNECTYRAEKYQ